MNKNEFYKQLMSEYSFDADKIKANARKGRFAGHNALPMYVGITAAAAALVVTVGTAVFMTLGSDRGVVYEGGKMTMTAAERLQKALEDIERNSGSEEYRDVLVTFVSPMYPDAARDILTKYSDDNKVDVKTVYLEDGTIISGDKWIEAAFNGESRMKGAVVYCAGADMAQLQEDISVFAVEIVEENELNSVLPIDTERGETIAAPPQSSVPEPEVTTLPPLTLPIDTYESEQPTAVTEETVETESIFETESGAIPVESEYTVEGTEGTEIDAETVDPPETVTVPPVPETEGSESEEIPAVNPDVQEPPAKTGLPEGVTLPGIADKLLYKTGDIGAETAFFIKDDVMFVKSADKISLYSFNGITEREIASEICSGAKIHWISENGSRMIVSGKDADGKRARLLYINADGGSIIDLGAEDVVMDGTISAVGYNEQSGLLVLNIKENGTYYVCASRFNGSGATVFLSTCYENTDKVTLLASEGDNIYLAVSGEEITEIYRVNSAGGYDPILIKTYGSEPNIAKNLAFTHAVMSPPDGAVIGFVEIFDPRSESFVSTNSFDAAINFGISRHSFSDSINCYTINGGALEAVSGIDLFAQIDYRKGLSSQFAAEAAGGCAVITDSEYSSRVRNGQLTFGALSDSAEEEIREAVNCAIGVNNMLAQNKAAQCGADTDEKLTQCIKAFYSEGAAEKLLQMKDSGELIPISVSDTVLTVSGDENTAVGILYVRAGTYVKKRAYLSYNIKLIYENGSWKLDCVIG